MAAAFAIKLLRRWTSPELRYRVIRAAASAHRSTLARRVTVIGITGSAGKTTTKELLAVALCTRFRCTKSVGNRNLRGQICRSLLQAGPWCHFHVQEVGLGFEPLPLEDPLSVLRPQIGVVTTVGSDHRSVYGGIEAIAAEKGKLIAALPASGTAVLNADDPNVLAMAARCRGRVVTFGLSSTATFRAENVSGAWPDRLTFDVVHRGMRLTARTQLVGTHWVPSVLAAIAAAVAAGVPFAAAVEAVGTVPPTTSRMQPVTTPDGVTFVRDDTKAPLSSFTAVLDFLRSARARRKFMVVGTISDYGGRSRTAYAETARRALDVADSVLFVGPSAVKCSAAKSHPRGHALHIFLEAEAARAHLRAVLDPGDLVLLKGSLYADSFDVLTELRASDSRPERQPQGRLPAGGAPALVVGLGNAGAQFRDTPHNVGYRAVEALAARAGAPWERLGDALVARFERDGHATYLAKLETQVNRSGPALLAVSHALGAGASDLMILADDINLPVGRTRVRLRGSDGGHRGVRSVLSSFGTDEVARVKIGVGPVPDTTTAVQHVLAPFAPEALRQVDADCCRAGDAVLQWLAGRPGGAMAEDEGDRPSRQAKRAGRPPDGRAMPRARGGSSPGGPSLS